MSKLAAVAGTAGVPLEQLGMGFKILEQRVGEAAEGNKEAITAFERLHISIEEATKLSSNPEALFERIQGALGGITDQGERAALAAGVLGRQGNNLIPIFTMAREEFDKTGDHIQHLGGTMSAADVELGKSMAKIEAYFTAGMMGIERAVSKPVLEYLETHMEGIESSIEVVVSAIVGGITAGWAAVSEETENLGAVLRFISDEVMPEISAAVSSVRDSIKAATPTQEMAGVLNDDFGPAVTAAVPLVEAFWSALQSLGRMAGDDLVESFRQLEPVIEDVGKVLAGTLGIVTSLVNQLNALGDAMGLTTGMATPAAPSSSAAARSASVPDEWGASSAVKSAARDDVDDWGVPLPKPAAARDEWGVSPAAKSATPDNVGDWGVPLPNPAAAPDEWTVPAARDDVGDWGVPPPKSAAAPEEWTVPTAAKPAAPDNVGDWGVPLPKPAAAPDEWTVPAAAKPAIRDNVGDWGVPLPKPTASTGVTVSPLPGSDKVMADAIASALRPLTDVHTVRGEHSPGPQSSNDSFRGATDAIDRKGNVLAAAIANIAVAFKTDLPDSLSGFAASVRASGGVFGELNQHIRDLISSGGLASSSWGNNASQQGNQRGSVGGGVNQNINLKLSANIDANDTATKVAQKIAPKLRNLQQKIQDQASSAAAAATARRSVEMSIGGF